MDRLRNPKIRLGLILLALTLLLFFPVQSARGDIAPPHIRFPLIDPSGMGDGFGCYPEIQDIQVRVNEKATTTGRVTTPTPNAWDQNAPHIAWAAVRTATPFVLATAPAPTPSPALVELSTPDSTPFSTSVEVAPVTLVPTTPGSAIPATFVAGVLVVGLCVIVLVALGGVGLAVWYLRRDMKSSQNAGRITKNDDLP